MILLYVSVTFQIEDVKLQALKCKPCVLEVVWPSGVSLQECLVRRVGAGVLLNTRISIISP